MKKLIVVVLINIISIDSSFIGYNSINSIFYHSLINDIEIIIKFY